MHKLMREDSHHFLSSFLGVLNNLIVCLQMFIFRVKRKVIQDG